MALRGILFDFNGTLFFDSDMHIEAFRGVYKLYGKNPPSTEDMVSTLFGMPNKAIYEKCFSPNPTAEELKSFIDLKENCYRDLCLKAPEKMKLVDGAYEMLDYLKENNIPYCLATGSDWENVSFYLEHLGLDRWFSKENMVYTDGTFEGKPNPDIYILAAARLGLTPAECLVFEDGTSGILAANAAGAGAVVAVYEEKYPTPLTEKTRVDRVFHDHLDWKSTLDEYGLLR